MNNMIRGSSIRRKPLNLRSTSTAFTSGDPSVVYFDDNNIQIIISSPDDDDYIDLGVSHRASSAAAASLQEIDETHTGVDEAAKQENLSSRKRKLYEYAVDDNWEGAVLILYKYKEIVRIPLTASGDTILHVAVSANSIDFVQQLVKLRDMTPKDLKMRNAEGNTAACIAAISGNYDCFQIMTQKNENLPLIPDHSGMLPVHLAAFTGHHKIVQDLTSDHLLDKMDYKDIQSLFFITIRNNMYDVAKKLFDKYSNTLAIARDHQEGLTALHMLARKPLKEYDMQEGALSLLFKKLWNQVRELEHQIMDLVTKPSAVLFDAVKSGNEDVAIWILVMNPEQLKIKDPKTGRNLLHFAILYRQKKVFDTILKMKTVNLIIAAMDNYGNNVLHFAPQHEQVEASTSMRPSIQMQREIEWFKKVENRVPPELRTMKNKQGKTPMDVFHAHQEKLSKQLKYSAIKIANSGMVVATLIATVAFAAALTTPGDDKSNAWFIVFILTNGVAVFTSSASIISFLSIFTSSKFTENEYVILLHPNLILGLMLLFISIATMVTAFVATSFLIFASKSKWVAYAMASLAPLPILLFPLLHVGLFIDYYYYYRCHRLLRISSDNDRVKDAFAF